MTSILNILYVFFLPFLKTKALVDHENSKAGKTALDQAAAHGHLDIVKYLHALEVSLHDSWSGNELMWAAAHDQSDMIKAHIDKGVRHAAAQ